MNVLTTQYLGEDFTFLDCPGSIEFLGDTLNVLPGIDAAVVVCEPDAAKVADAAALPQAAVGREDSASVCSSTSSTRRAARCARCWRLLQEASETPLLLRQIPIWEHGVATGFVDLALERAFAYRPHAASEVVDIADYAREKEARFQMLEKLADYDEHLMEELLGDVEPPRDEVFGELKRELAEGLVVPVLIGSAEGDNGVRRLLKALRHDVPEVAAAAARAGIDARRRRGGADAQDLPWRPWRQAQPGAGAARAAQGRRGAAWRGRARSPHRRHLRAGRRQADQAHHGRRPATRWRWRGWKPFATGEIAVHRQSRRRSAPRSSS